MPKPDFENTSIANLCTSELSCCVRELLEQFTIKQGYAHVLLNPYIVNGVADIRCGLLQCLDSIGHAASSDWEHVSFFPFLLQDESAEWQGWMIPVQQDGSLLHIAFQAADVARLAESFMK